VPVVTRDLPVLREVFGGTAAFATDPAGFADALLAAAAQPDAGRAAAGRALADGHDWDTAAAAHLALYGRLGRTGAGG
jgi:glycosyltransferase involved in cell wall biosynthesis